MASDDHEQRRLDKRRAFAERMGMNDEQRASLEKIIDDFNAQYRSALDFSSVPGSLDDEQTYEHISAGLDAANQKAVSSIQALSPAAKPSDVVLLLGPQMDAQTLVMMRAFGTKYADKMSVIFAESIAEVAGQKKP